MEKTSEQKRAAHALNVIKSMQGNQDGKYRSYVQGLPASIVMDGLGQMAATLLVAAKGKTEDDHHRLHDNLQDWLRTAGAIDPQRTLLEFLTACTQDQYIWAQAEALSYLVWLKKFSQAYLAEGVNAEGLQG